MPLLYLTKLRNAVPLFLSESVYSTFQPNEVPKTVSSPSAEKQSYTPPA